MSVNFLLMDLVIRKPYASIHKDHLPVRVPKATQEMVSSVQASVPVLPYEIEIYNICIHSNIFKRLPYMNIDSIVFEDFEFKFVII